MNDKVKYEVQGMACAGCQRAVVSALTRAGVAVQSEDVSLQEGTVLVPAAVADSVVRQTISDAGYEVGERRVQQ